jgi:single-strand DNA-binding protein
MIRSGVNRVILIGYLERNPEKRSLKDGTDITHLIIVTPEVWQDKRSGQERSREEEHRVVIFNDGLGRIARDYLHKDSWVYVCGRLRINEWTDQAGVQHTDVEVVLPAYSGELQLLDRREGNGK